MTLKFADRESLRIRFTKMYLSGLKMVTIASRLGLTVNYCQELRRGYKIPPRPTGRTSETLVDGKPVNITELAKRYGMSPGLISARLYLGWSLERALTTPKRRDIRTDRRNQRLTMRHKH